MFYFRSLAPKTWFARLVEELIAKLHGSFLLGVIISFGCVCWTKPENILGVKSLSVTNIILPRPADTVVLFIKT
jgi:hypothetical protein